MVRPAGLDENRTPVEDAGAGSLLQADGEVRAPGCDPALVSLRLAHFRNHAALRLEVEPRHVVLVGDNGVGKTNLLEAISLLTPGRGLRRAAYAEMRRFGTAAPWTVFAALERADGRRVALGTGLDPERGEAGARRVHIDGVAAERVEDLLLYLRVLWLTPAMDGLFAGPASDRRKFLDRLVLALDPGHGARVAAFERAARGRNRLLEAERPDPVWLSGVETQMAELAVAIAAARLDCVGHLQRLAGTPAKMPAGFPHADLSLEGTLEAALAAGAPALAAEESYRAALAEARPRDAAAGRTLEGPHRTDLRVVFGPKGIAADAASTGEQKALLLGLVLAHAALVGELAGEPPILLLDEVAAHFDEGRRVALFEAVDRIGGQAWMTGTDAAIFAPFGERAQILAVGGEGVRRLR